jgi:hypothetical protein
MDPVETLEGPDFSDDVMGRLVGIAGEEGLQVEAVQQEQDEDAAKKARAAEQEHTDGWRQAVGMVAGIICAPFPEAAPTWSNDRMDALAGALARCDSVYGWGGVGGLFAHPLIGLAVASFPLAVGTAKAIGEARAKKEAGQAPKGAISGDAMGDAVAPTAAVPA